MGYKKIQAVPSIMIDYQSASLFQCLSAEEKEIVWDSIMNYVDVARQRDSDNVEPFLQEGLSKVAYKVFDGMLNSIDSGFAMYWKSCEKNSERVKKRWEKQKEDAVVYRGIPQDTEMSRKDMNKKNISNISYPPYTEQIMNTDKREEFIDIIKLLQAEGFNPSESQVDDVARKMKFDFLDYETAVHCINVCKKRDTIGMGAFLGVFGKVAYEGWDNQVI